MKLSIIIPTLNEAEHIENTLSQLQALRQKQHEIIVVDGGSNDNTVELARPLSDCIIQSKPGRAIQMNTGAEYATGDVYWFLHGDTLAPKNADRIIEQQLHTSDRHWGRFNVRLSGHQSIFRLIAWLMNLRSCITGIATGDQGIFINATAFKKLEGFKPIALMEDIEISKRLLTHYGRPVCITKKLQTSSRRWEQHGIIKTVLLMWRLRLAYFFGSTPDRLAKQYSR